MKTKEEVEKVIRDNMNVRIDRFMALLSPEDKRLEDDEWDWEYAFIEYEFL